MERSACAICFGLCIAVAQAVADAAMTGPGHLGPSLGPIRDSNLDLSDVVWQPETSVFLSAAQVLLW